MTVAAPVTSTTDLFSDETLKNTEAVFAELRELAPVVYLPANECWAITRYGDVRDALGPSGAIRVDANGAWDVAGAVASGNHSRMTRW